MDSLEEIAVFLQRECEKHGVAADDLRVLELIGDELVSNICRYAYPGEVGEFELTIHLGAGRCTLQFVDQGVPFDPTRQEPPDIEASIEERGIGGLGILFVRSESECFEYERHDDSNVVTVCKRLESRAGDALAPTSR